MTDASVSFSVCVCLCVCYICAGAHRGHRRHHLPHGGCDTLTWPRWFWDTNLGPMQEQLLSLLSSTSIFVLFFPNGVQKQRNKQLKTAYLQLTSFRKPLALLNPYHPVTACSLLVSALMRMLPRQ